MASRWAPHPPTIIITYFNMAIQDLIFNPYQVITTNIGQVTMSETRLNMKMKKLGNYLWVDSGTKKRQSHIKNYDTVLPQKGDFLAKIDDF
jgi:hypothetical protein